MQNVKIINLKECLYDICKNIDCLLEFCNITDDDSPYFKIVRDDTRFIQNQFMPNVLSQLNADSDETVINGIIIDVDVELNTWNQIMTAINELKKYEGNKEDFSRQTAQLIIRNAELLDEDLIY